MIFAEGKWKRINDAFLPANAKQVFQSTMPKTRGEQSWACRMLEKLQEDREGLMRECREKGWYVSFNKLLRDLPDAR